MTNAIAGAIATMTKGNATASVRTPTASRRVIVTRGEHSSITGKSVKADMDQSETNRTPVKGASRGGASSTAQNAAAARRRAGDDGQAMSLTAARLGRAMTDSTKSGTATEARRPAR